MKYSIDYKLCWSGRYGENEQNKKWLYLHLTQFHSKVGVNYISYARYDSKGLRRPLLRPLTRARIHLAVFHKKF